MIRAARQISFTILISLFLILMIAFCITGTVISQGKNQNAIETRYYREMEQEYVVMVRRFLAEEGYENCGVTMTEVAEPDGSRSYTVTIHHRKIDTLSEEDKEKLLAACDTLIFPDQTCKISHKFLEEDL